MGSYNVLLQQAAAAKQIGFDRLLAHFVQRQVSFCSLVWPSSAVAILDIQGIYLGASDSFKTLQEEHAREEEQRQAQTDAGAGVRHHTSCPASTT
jgi:hypothetical protein